MPSFETFDQRNYRTVSVREGYSSWVPTYEDTVEDDMDLALLDRIADLDWSAADAVVDLGCGTGRTARWLSAKGARTIDGVDVTAEMLERARARGLHRRLVEADVRATGLPEAAYDLAVCSLVDEHLPELTGLYSEARRLLRPGGTFVIVGYHPFFIMASGMPTHFDGPDDEPVAIETHLHLLSEHMAAAREVSFIATELHEAVVDDEWLRFKPSWNKYEGWPFSFAWVWRSPR